MVEATNKKHKPQMMPSVLITVRLKLLVMCFVMSLFVFATTIKFNRHCPVCCQPVKVEYALTLGVSGFMNDYDIIHTSCWGAWNGTGDLRNFFSLADSEQDSLKQSL